MAIDCHSDTVQLEFGTWRTSLAIPILQQKERTDPFNKVHERYCGVRCEGGPPEMGLLGIPASDLIRVAPKEMRIF